MRKKTNLPAGHLKIMFAASCVIFLWALYIAASGEIKGYELSVFRSVNNWADSLRGMFLVLTQAGSAWMLFGVTLFLVWQKRHRLAVRVFGMGAAAFLLAQVFKHAVGRGRPAALLADVRLRESMGLGHGFPSAHTAVATVVSLALIMLLPARWRWLCVVWIILVGLSRIYLGVHAPMDVVGGFAVGVAVVSGSYLVRNKLKFVTKITHLKLSD